MPPFEIAILCRPTRVIIKSFFPDYRLPHDPHRCMMIQKATNQSWTPLATRMTTYLSTETASDIEHENTVEYESEYDSSGSEDNSGCTNRAHF